MVGAEWQFALSAFARGPSDGSTRLIRHTERLLMGVR